MRILFLGAAIFFWGTALAQQSEVVQVVRVLSADSIVVVQAGREKMIRVLGLACPSRNRTDPRGNDVCSRAKNLQKCREKFAAGEAASKFAQDQLLNKDVTLECTDFCDKAPRFPLRYIKLSNGKDYSDLVLSEGLCDAARMHPAHTREKLYVAVRDKAKKAKKGIFK